jgi:hypothetical protein
MRLHCLGPGCSRWWPDSTQVNHGPCEHVCLSFFSIIFFLIIFYFSKSIFQINKHFYLKART